MLYNFDEVIERRDTGSVKWHYSDETIPLWVADMDFKTAQPILAAIEQVAQHGILGYTVPTEPLYQAIIDWHGSRYDLWLDKQDNLEKISFKRSSRANLRLQYNFLRLSCQG